MTLVVLLGGTRSGKSALAVELGIRRGGDVTFVATAEVRDSEMAERVARHRQERPAHWRLVEEPRELAAVPALQPVARELVIVDCLPLWLSNLIELGRDDGEVMDAARAVATLAARRVAPVVAVTNEVGMGVVPATPLGRRFRDLLGAVNRVFVASARSSLLVVGGRVLRLEPAPLEDLLGEIDA